MNTLSETVDSPAQLSLVSRLVLFVGGTLTAAMSLSLFLAVVLNWSALYQAEVLSLNVIMETFGSAATAGVVFAAGIWIPVVICILAFAIVIAGVAIVIFSTWVQQLAAFISATSAVCPTLGFFQRSLCWAAVAGAVALLVAATGLFFTAAAIVLINILVILLIFV